MRNQKGVISLFVLFAMLFLLIICLSMYLGIRNKFQMQKYEELELQEIYSIVDTSEGIEYVSIDEIIPIYNINQLNVAGTGSFLKVNNKIYECGRGMSYVLKNNIIVDIDEDLRLKKVGANDYKLYSSSYYIENLSYEIYYYKEDRYWKCIAYQKFNENENSIVNNKTYLNEKFSIIGNYEFQNNNTFMILWNDKNGNLSNFEIKNQNINNITNINQIDVFRENIGKINKLSGEFYLFIDVGESI